jgi:hypothetical protein
MFQTSIWEVLGSNLCRNAGLSSLKYFTSAQYLDCASTASFEILFNSSVVFTFDAYLLTCGPEPFLRSSQLCSYSGTSQHFVEPEGSLPCSQEPSTGPYPEPDRSSPYHPICLRSILILSTDLRLGLSSGLFPSGFPTNILYAFLFSPIRATCPAHFILLDLIILIMLCEEYNLLLTVYSVNIDT